MLLQLHTGQLRRKLLTTKFSSLADLLKIIGPENLKFFNYSRQDQSHVFFINWDSSDGEASKKCKGGTLFGLLCDEVIDISVLELLITFIQFLNSKTDKVETHFLFVEDVLKDSTFANAETIVNILIRKLDHYGLQLQKLSTIASNGAAVVVGKFTKADGPLLESST